MSMREGTRTARYFHAIDPGAALAGVTQQMRSLSAVVVVRRSKPPYLVRGQRDDPFLAWFVQICSPCDRRNDGDRGNSGGKDPVHFLLLSETCLVRGAQRNLGRHRGNRFRFD